MSAEGGRCDNQRRAGGAWSSIVATLREIILHGATELAWKLILALTAFLVALAAVLRFGDLRLGVSRSRASGGPDVPDPVV